jgi:polar amino acid transport system substrate-binding protein
MGLPIRSNNKGPLAWLLLRIAVTAALSVPSWMSNAAPVVQLCEDDSYAPFVYADPATPDNPRGATAAWVGEMFERAGIAYKITLMPWARCMNAVQQGLFQIGMDAYYDSDRAKTFVYSKPYFTLTPQYYYSRKRHPSGLKIASRRDLKKYQGCGIQGYSYDHYGLNVFDLDFEANNHSELVEKIEYGRCDYFVEELEIMRGFSLFGQHYLADADLGHGAVPDVPAPQLHFILGRNNAQSSWLLPFLNEQIRQSQQHGTLLSLVNHYLDRSH